MRFGSRFGAGVALSLALFAGDAATLSFSPSPAVAGDHYRGGYRGGYGGGGYYGRGYHRGGGFGFGDALLGAVIIGGAAAIISSANRGPAYDSYQTYPPAPPPAYGYDDGEVRYDAPPPSYAQTDPVEQCSRAAEREAQARGGFARVLGIDHVDGRPNGAHVNGTIEISSGPDRNGNYARTDRTKFDCTADYGQITGLRLG